MSVPRRVGVIGFAVAVIAATGVWSAWPAAQSIEKPAAASSLSVLSGPFLATYDFLTPELGWSVVIDYSAFRSRAWMFKTVDGGAHWEREYFTRALGDRVYLHFFDALHGFAYTGYPFRTVDGGVHWLTIDVPGTRPYVTFSSPTQGWAEAFDARGPHMYLTVDAGKHWTSLGTVPAGSGVLQPSSEIHSSPFREDCEGWLGSNGQSPSTVFVTTDCGHSWQGIEIAHMGSPVNRNVRIATSVRLVSDGGVAVFFGDTMLEAVISYDTGSTWQGLALPAAIPTSGALTLLDSTHWWVFSNGLIYKTDDSGSSWQETQPFGLPPSMSFQEARAIDRTHAWVSLASSSGLDRQSLAVTSDGGDHWELVSEPLP